MKIGDYFNVLFKDGTKNTIGIVRVDQISDDTDTLVDGPVLTGKGIIANWQKISDGNKSLGFRTSKATVAAYKQYEIKEFNKKIKAVKKF